MMPLVVRCAELSPTVDGTCLPGESVTSRMAMVHAGNAWRE